VDQDTRVAEKNIRRRLLTFLRPYRFRFLAALGAMVVYGATDGCVPFLVRSILDDVFGKGRTEMLYFLPALVIVFAVIRGVFGFLQSYLSASVGHSIVCDIRNAIHERLLILSPAFFERSGSGALISRVTNDTLVVRFAITDVLTTALRESVRIVALLGAALYLDPVLGLMAFVVFPLGVLPVIKFGRKVRKLSRVGQDQFGGLTGVLQESIQGHRIVQSFNQESLEREKFRAENEQLTKTFVKAERYGAFAAPTNEFLASLAISGILLYGGISVMSGVRTQGDFIAFITAMFLLYEPLKRLGRVNATYQAALSAGERILEVLDAQPEIFDRPGATELSRTAQRVEFRNVSFTYPTANEESAAALKNVDLKIEPGETVALVGMSGGGKSTLVNLLPRFYDPIEGGIFVGGKDIRDYTLRSLRDAISIVSQHTFLFNDTILANIQYGRTSATREEILEAARHAYAHEFIERMPQKYETIVGEQGLRLSGGERARIAIARALLKDAPFLILDEATASLDSESEAIVQQAIDFLMTKRTVLVVAHRLATIRRANRIAVVSHGRIVESGTHEELLSRPGEFSKLYQIQFLPQAGAEPAARKEAVAGIP